MVGFVGAFVGVGGGILLLLIFMFLAEGLEFNQFEKVRIVIANTAIVLLGVQLVLGSKRIASKRFYFKNSVAITIPAVIVAAIVSYFLIYHALVSLTVFKIFFILFVFYSSYILITNKERRIFEKCCRGGIRGNTRNFGAGTLSGLTTALTGSDSGIFIVPVLNKYCDIDIRKAVNIYNTSLIFILLIVVGMYTFPLGNAQLNSNDFLGYIHLPYAIPMLLGAALAALPGYSLFNKIKFNYFVYPLVFIFAITAIRIVFYEIIFPLYN